MDDMSNGRLLWLRYTSGSILHGLPRLVVNNLFLSILYSGYSLNVYVVLLVTV